MKERYLLVLVKHLSGKPESGSSVSTGDIGSFDTIGLVCPCGVRGRCRI